MHFHHLHFYVRDAAFWRDWFVRRLSFQSVPTNLTPAPADRAKSLAATPDAHCLNDEALVAGIACAPQPSVVATAGHLAAGHALLPPWGERVVQGQIDIRLSDPMGSPAAAAYLKQHPPGVVDIAFATEHFDQSLSRLRSQGATLLAPISLGEDGLRQCRLKGWADLCHTLVEVLPSWVRSTVEQRSQRSMQRPSPADLRPDNFGPDDLLAAIDHVVLNVPQGELMAAVEWYQQIFGLECGQQFDIQTAQSGLRSQVLVHPEGSLQLPINEPSSANSQIQEFLNHNRGAGVQHVALRSDNAVGAIAQFRQRGLDLISVPKTYYDGLHQRADCPMADTTAASAQQLLLDWAKGGHQGLLMQTFTKPIFAEPTFFFEIIERGLYSEQGQLKNAQGFGEGNFQALFEAIERAQLERGTLK